MYSYESGVSHYYLMLYPSDAIVPLEAKLIRVSILLPVILLVLAGCSLESISPSSWSGDYYAQETDNSDYYVIKIMTDTSGEVYLYNDNTTPDDRTDDTLTSTNTFTITDGAPWLFNGGAFVNSDACPVGASSIRVADFNGEASAYFPASGTSYP